MASPKDAPDGFGDWNQVWLDAQRQYLESWSQLAQAGAPAAPKGGNPFAEGLDFWSNMALGAMPSQSRDLGQRLFQMSNDYMRMGEGLWTLMQGTQETLKAGGNWQKKFEDFLKQFQTSVMETAATVNPSAGLATFWGMPLQHWRQLSSSLSVMPGDVEKALRGEGPPGMDTFQRALNSSLSMPAFGYTREWQEDIQEWGRHWLEHAQAVQKYEQVFAQVTARAFELLGQRLTGMLKEGKTFSSLRETYDVWIDCAEEAYAESATTEEFAQVQANLTNSMMALKHHEQLLMVEMQSALNIPTRRELNTTHCRVHEQRREIRALRHRIEDLEDLEQTVAELRGEVRALKATRPPRPKTSPAPASPPAARKKAVKKTATARPSTKKKEA